MYGADFTYTESASTRDLARGDKVAWHRIETDHPNVPTGIQLRMGSMDDLRHFVDMYEQKQIKAGEIMFSFDHPSMHEGFRVTRRAATIQSINDQVALIRTRLGLPVSIKSRIMFRVS